jgi:hypothetical protein
MVLATKVSDAHLMGLRSDGVSYIFAGDARPWMRLRAQVTTNGSFGRRARLETHSAIPRLDQCVSFQLIRGSYSRRGYTMMLRYRIGHSIRSSGPCRAAASKSNASPGSIR